MSRDVSNRDGIYGTVACGFSHAATSTSQKVIHCSGQIAWDKDYNGVRHGGLAAQCGQVFKSLKEDLAAWRQPRRCRAYAYKCS